VLAGADLLHNLAPERVDCILVLDVLVVKAS